MKITIHRGANQIGGCITEIESAKGDRIFIDFGHNLPEGDETSMRIPICCGRCFKVFLMSITRTTTATILALNQLFTRLA
ncbi:MAG: hypothetical protein J6T98_03680 [Salinivirgaceae bacterium]|nr:hypothetical protein [Salinivirgaceae bacterium]